MIVEPETGPVAAGGTIARPQRSLAFRLWLVLECAVLFIAAPLGMHWVVHGEKIPIFVALLPVLAIAVFLLVVDRTFRLRRELRRGFSWGTALSIVLLLALIGGVATWWVLEHRPHWFLEFPTNRPETYARIMIAYPIFSVAAQELLYRSFFFHRYGPLFGRYLWLAVIVNGLLFGFGHIVMNSPFALAATTAGGLVLAARYAATRSFWAVFIEHTLWGWLVFTVGLGRFFFTGVSNV